MAHLLCINNLIRIDGLSRLRINLEKTVILRIGQIENVESLAMELSCKIGDLPSYLGLSLGALHKSMAVWEG